MASLPLVPRSLLVLFALAGGAASQQVVTLSGPVFDGTGGPLVPGVVYRAVGDLDVPPGETLTVQAGVILKFDLHCAMAVHGTLLTQPTAVFTSIEDDTIGGDTGGNGPTTGRPGNWTGLRFLPDAHASTLHGLEVRFAGNGQRSSIDLQSCDLTMDGCLVRDAAADALTLRDTSRPTVTACRFEDNGGVAVARAPLDALPAFHGNTAARNAGGDHVQVTAGTIRADIRIDAGSVLGGALVLESRIDVPPARTLKLGPGVVLKWKHADGALLARGNLSVLGTAHEPVVFTAFADDRHGGDTNGDGPSRGVPGAWRGVTCDPDPLHAQVLEHAVLAFAGSQGEPALWIRAPGVSATAIRAERSTNDGIRARALTGIAANWVAFDNANHGIELTGGAFDVAHATSISNGGTGILAAPAWSGSLHNSISWGHGTNLSGLAPPHVLHCDGDLAFAGTNGNIHADPLLVDAPNGDLRLSASSPCLGTADAAIARAVLEDHLQAPRLLDDALTGTMLPDMGAYERAAWDLTVTGTPTLGTQVTLSVTGPTGFVHWLVGPDDGHTELAPLGTILAGRLPSITVLPTLYSVPTTLALPLPNQPGFEGLTVAVQPVVFLGTASPRGNFLPACRLRLRR